MSCTIVQHFMHVVRECTREWRRLIKKIRRSLRCLRWFSFLSCRDWGHRVGPRSAMWGHVSNVEAWVDRSRSTLLGDINAGDLALWFTAFLFLTGRAIPVHILFAATHAWMGRDGCAQRVATSIEYDDSDIMIR